MNVPIATRIDHVYDKRSVLRIGRNNRKERNSDLGRSKHGDAIQVLWQTHAILASHFP
jgi:hypothetical protein